jgi:hypothetical protein
VRQSIMAALLSALFVRDENLKRERKYYSSLFSCTVSRCKFCTTKRESDIRPCLC